MRERSWLPGSRTHRYFLLEAEAYNASVLKKVTAGGMVLITSMVKHPDIDRISGADPCCLMLREEADRGA